MSAAPRPGPRAGEEPSRGVPRRDPFPEPSTGIGPAVTGTLFLVVTVIITALFFDFTNGFHDSANAMATSVATGALRPAGGRLIAAVLNVLGAFLSTEVAKTISGGMVDDALVTPTMIFAGLVAAILWNLLTWLFGLPSQFVARAVRGVDRRGAGGRGNGRGQLLGGHVQDRAAGDRRPGHRRARGRARHLAGVPAAAPGGREPRGAAGSGGRRPCRGR